MILNATKEFFVKRKYNKLLKGERSLTEGFPIQTVGVVFDANHYLETADWSSLVSFFGKGVQLEAVCYIDEKPDESPAAVTFFNAKDFDALGRVKSGDLANFLAKPFDLLVGYYEADNLFLNYLVAQSESRFRAGLNPEDKRLYDLLIKVSDNGRDQFSLELFKYLKILKRLK